MPTAEEDSPAPAKRRKPSRKVLRAPKPQQKVLRAAKVGWGLYQQIAAAFAAFGIAAIIGHFWEIGWRGAVATIVGVWNITIRPAMEWILHVLVTVPLGWLGADFEVPLWVRDYLSVGLILMASGHRARRARRQFAARSAFATNKRVERAMRRRVAGSLLTGFSLIDPHRIGNILAVIFWPLSVLVVVVLWLAAIVGVRRWDDAVRTVIEDLRTPQQPRDGYLDIFSAILKFAERQSRLYPGTAFTNSLLYWLDALPMRAQVLDEDAALEVSAIGAIFVERIKITLLALSPLFYLALLFAVNLWLMPHI